jgi:hypothetical protein
MMTFGMVPPTWDNCCGLPRAGAAPLFVNGSERLVCSVCGSWCNKPSTPEPEGRSRTTQPAWYERMWAT